MDNQFGLVYTDAITENKAGQVNLRPVTYRNKDGIKLAANLYLPANYDPESHYPAVIVAHPNGGVKEQVAGLFAQKLAEQGYLSLAFDAAYQGASEGMPRQTDLPANRVEDIHAGLDFLLSVPGVTPDRVGALGICGGGGYTLQTAKSDKRIKAVVTISMFNTGRVRRNGFKDSDKANTAKRFEMASAAREKYVTTGEVDYIGQLLTHQTHFSKEDLEKIPAGLYRDGVQYYGDTHYHPNAQSRYTTMSLLGLMTFDVENQAELLAQPLLMMTGDVSDTRYMTDDFFKKATGTDDKQVVYIKGANHIETYWKPEYVQEEAQHLINFFNQKLGE
jgi:fermentation-respiration switch protein FrsA (DUF1100 family)